VLLVFKLGPLPLNVGNANGRGEPPPRPPRPPITSTRSTSQCHALTAEFAPLPLASATVKLTWSAFHWCACWSTPKHPASPRQGAAHRRLAAVSRLPVRADGPRNSGQGVAPGIAKTPGSERTADAGVAGDSNAIGGALPLFFAVVLLWVLLVIGGRGGGSPTPFHVPTLTVKAKLNTNRHQALQSLQWAAWNNNQISYLGPSGAGKLRDCCVFEMFRSLCVQGGERWRVAGRFSQHSNGRSW